jgi:hypothetical protein
LSAARLAAVAWLALGPAGCARSGLLAPASDDDSGSAGQGPSTPPAECTLDADCAQADPCLDARCKLEPDPDAGTPRGVCVTTPVDCDDGDACSADRCDGAAGGCVHERPVDADRDGFLGQAPDGVPASCGGQDCDDGDASVHPGASDACDGKDNDCDGAIDQGLPLQRLDAPVKLAPAMMHTELGSLAFGAGGYGVAYTARNAAFNTQGYFGLLDRRGGFSAGPALVSDINADSYGGSIDFSGSSFLSVWSDARQSGNYELYATRFDARAQKLEADQRITNAAGFSVRPEVRFTGSEYVVVWEDHRFEATGGGGAILGHRLSTDGMAVGDEVLLTGSGEDADFPGLAVAGGRLGVTYVVADPAVLDGSIVRFRSFDLTLADGTPSVELGSDAQDPVVEAVGDHFVVAWHTGSEGRNWGPSIRAATLDTRGNVLASGPVTFGDAHAKTRALVSFGDRALLVWSAVQAEGDPFALFYETFALKDLSLVAPRLVLATSDHDLVDPLAVRGANGEIGVGYDDYQAYSSYFTSLSCGTPSQPR